MGNGLTAVGHWLSLCQYYRFAGIRLLERERQMSNRLRWAAFGLAAVVPALVGLRAPVTVSAQSAPGGDVTFTRDIAPILQRSCQRCHNNDGVAPMPLISYEDVRPWARAMKTRTSMGPKAGVMPPWFVEKDMGIQKFKD